MNADPRCVRINIHICRFAHLSAVLVGVRPHICGSRGVSIAEANSIRLASARSNHVLYLVWFSASAFDGVDTGGRRTICDEVRILRHRARTRICQFWTTFAICLSSSMAVALALPSWSRNHVSTMLTLLGVYKSVLEDAIPSSNSSSNPSSPQNQSSLIHPFQ
jgi:hypothetical protein